MKEMRMDPLPPRPAAPLPDDPAAGAERQVSILALARTLRRGRWVIIPAMLAGGLLAGIAGFARPATFEASTEIIVDLPDNASDVAVASAIDDHLTMLTSPTLLRKLLAAGGAGVPAPAEAEEEEVAPTSLLAALGPLEGWMAKAGEKLGLRPMEAADGVDTKQLAALRRMLDVERAMQSRVITVTAKAEDPAEAARLANNVVALYLDELTARSRASDSRELETLAANLPMVEGRLVDAIRELETQRLRTGAGFADEVDDSVREMSHLERQRVGAQAALDATTARLARIAALEASGASETALAEAAGVADGAAGSIGAAVARLTAEAGVYKSQLQLVDDRAAALTAAASETASHLARLAALQEQVDTASGRYDEMLSRQSLLIQQLNSTAPGVSVLSEAWTPTEPAGLSPIFLVPPGMILGGLFAAVLVLYRSERDRSLRGERECEGALGVPCAGFLPPLDAPASALPELVAASGSVYGRATRMLLMALAGPRSGFRLPQRILVTATAPGEGKEELAWTLAVAAAQGGSRVGFLDLAPPAEPITTRLAADAQRPPHGDAGSAPARLSELGIDYIPAAGGSHAPLGEPGSSPGLLDQLAGRYDVLVVNAPTCLEGPEASQLAVHADLLIFAVAWGTTSRDLAGAAVARVRAGDAPVMAVLTRFDAARHADYGFGDAGDLLAASLPPAGGARNHGERVGRA